MGKEYEIYRQSATKIEKAKKFQLKLNWAFNLCCIFLICDADFTRRGLSCKIETRRNIGIKDTWGEEYDKNSNCRG